VNALSAHPASLSVYPGSWPLRRCGSSVGFGGGVITSGCYFSSTVGGLGGVRSRLELARIQLADFDPDVVGSPPQPFQLTGRNGAVRRRHVPDLLLRRANGAVAVVDVEPADRVDDPVGGRCSTGPRACWVARWRFEVWSGAGPGAAGERVFGRYRASR